MLHYIVSLGPDEDEIVIYCAVKHKNLGKKSNITMYFLFHCWHWNEKNKQTNKQN